jgi:hypothetical protein
VADELAIEPLCGGFSGKDLVSGTLWHRRSSHKIFFATRFFAEADRPRRFEYPGASVCLPGQGRIQSHRSMRARQHRKFQCQSVGLAQCAHRWAHSVSYRRSVLSSAVRSPVTYPTRDYAIAGCAGKLQGRLRGGLTPPRVPTMSIAGVCWRWSYIPIQ